MPRFGTVLTAMVTPFDTDGTFAPKQAAALATWLVENGSQGLVVAGTTGESPTLSVEEHLALVEAAVGAVEVPVLAGTGSNDTRHAIAMTEMATERGADGVLLVAPYYNKPSQAGLLDHFSQIAAATALPAMIYDIPGRTGRKISTEVLLELAEIPNVVALKDAAGDVAETASLIARAPEGFEVYSGDDNLTLPLVAVGAVGVVSVASHWAGSEIGQMVRDAHEGDLQAAIDQNARLIPSYEFESSLTAPNPVPTKAMMRHLGFEVGACRPPMGPEPADLSDRAGEVIAGLRGAT